MALVLVLGGSKSSSGPKDVADKFFKADIAKNVSAMKDLACDPIKSKINSNPSAAGDKGYKIGTVNENGNTAQVGVSLTDPDGKPADYTALLQKQSGKWKVCDLVAGSPSNGPSGGGGGGGGDAAAAEQTVQKLLQAGKDRDLSTAQSLTCEPLHSQIEDVPEISDFQVGSGSASGSSATVPFTVTSEGEKHDEVAELQQQNGNWKVCDFHDSSDSSSGGSTDGPAGPSGFPSDFPSDTDIPSVGESKICFTPNGSTPICVP